MCSHRLTFIPFPVQKWDKLKPSSLLHVKVMLFFLLPIYPLLGWKIQLFRPDVRYLQWFEIKVKEVGNESAVEMALAALSAGAFLTLFWHKQPCKLHPVSMWMWYNNACIKRGGVCSANLLLSSSLECYKGGWEVVQLRSEFMTSTFYTIVYCNKIRMRM